MGPSMNPSAGQLESHADRRQRGRASYCSGSGASVTSREQKSVPGGGDHPVAGMGRGGPENSCGDQGLGLPRGILPERLECRCRRLRADRILLEDLLRDLAADHLGRMRGSRRLRCDGFPWIGLPLGSELSGTARLRALGLSELLLRAREYERRRRSPSPAELGYWWLARARIYKALMELQSQCGSP